MGEKLGDVTSEVMTGSTVFHKSGGPRLIVSDIKRTDDIISVEWFDGSTLHRDDFHPDCLSFLHPDTFIFAPYEESIEERFARMELK